MNAPRHGHTEDGNGGGVVIGCVAVAVLGFAVALGATVYFLYAPSVPHRVPHLHEPPLTGLPTTSSYPAAVEPEAEAAPNEAAGEGTVISAIDPSAEVGASEDERNAHIPVIRTGSADVRGSLDRDVIRRVIRRHINEVRHCYEQGLLDDPSLSGRVAVAFIIDATGAVSQANLTESTFVDSATSGAVVECILGALRTWQFPAPEGGGIVGVNYPFVLTSG